MNTEILNQFSKYIENQDILCKLTQSAKLNEFSYSEISVIIAVGTLEEPNGVEIAKQLKMTKGGITKISKRLLLKNVIETYKIPENKQKIFYRLTIKGKELFLAHKERHDLWIKRDNEFLNKFDKTKLNEILSFINLYNSYLENKIAEFQKEEST